MFKGNPDVRAGCENLEPGADVWIRVAKVFESLPVQLALWGHGWASRESLLFKKLMPRFLRMKSGIVNDGAGFRFDAATG